MAYAQGQGNPNGYHPSGRVNLARVVVQHRASGWWFVEDLFPPEPTGIISVMDIGEGKAFQAIGPAV